VVVSIFQAILVLAAFVGLGIPAWVFSLAVYHGAKRPRSSEPSARFFAYSRLIESIHSQARFQGDMVIENGALFAATIRELKNYPEFKDISLFYLEEIDITGSSKFDQIMKSELEAVEAHLLGLRDE
jgi:hypothetical protein